MPVLTDVVDLSVPFYEGMPTDDLGPKFWVRLSHAASRRLYQDTQTSMLLSEHAGTHLDSPYHFDEDGLAIEQLPLPRLFARARVFDLTRKQPLEGIGPEDLEDAARRHGVDLAPGDAAVIWTEHSRNYERPDYTWHRPFITAAGAAWLAERRPGVVVTDLVGLDEPADPVTPVHNRLLRAGIPQLQVLTNVRRLAEGESWVAAFPLKLVGGTGAPLRAFGALA